MFCLKLAFRMPGCAFSIVSRKEETRSRRIVPTQVSCLGPSADQTSSFTKVTNVPAPAKVMPRSIWAKPPENITDLINPSGSVSFQTLTLLKNLNRHHFTIYCYFNEKQ